MRHNRPLTIAAALWGVLAMALGVLVFYLRRRAFP
jgi:hypothetical protein